MLTELSTKVNLKTANLTAEESIDLLTEKSTKVNSMTTNLTAEESSDMLTETFIMELGLMIRSMAASYIPTQMVERRERSG